MNNYRYVCMTLRGELLTGEYAARDKNDLVWSLWRNKLFLVWWEEIEAESPNASEIPGWGEGQISPVRLESLWRRKTAKERSRIDSPESFLQKSEDPFPAGSDLPQLPSSGIPWSWDDYPVAGVLRWIADHSGGAIRTNAQAVSIVSVVALLIIGTTFNALHSIKPRATNAQMLSEEEIAASRMVQKRVSRRPSPPSQPGRQ